ncbi:formate C-acetyltransferase [Serpentinicella sp. ANB-PHB4]|uniref:formate C-acetyltransferase n=1 Tax=Serpentinicella sp. ANB-PHB4 TaxID=3074076 RepID=UPI00285F152F|nr:formate C-acetyltransferase [Serpentinicella sp. ANB-PHB4]MDR5659451.1 formate C-acetyltransferase [Serpentinicella sp. ANB-PHB4]
MFQKAWRNFKEGKWQKDVDVRDFIQKNYSLYEGDDNFLESATDRTKELMEQFNELQKLEQEKGGVLDIDTNKVSSLLTYAPGYLNKEKEIVLGLQTDQPLKRGVNPFGGMLMARQACESYGYALGQEIEDHFKYRTTHNDGVFRVYSDEMKKLRSSGVITGLPDAYGRGRVIGDYRRVALYGIDKLIEEKRKDKQTLGKAEMNEETIRLSEELFRQIDFLNKLKEMALAYGIDISKPATTAKEAVQWLYFAYLGAIKEQNGAAMSLGRVSTFLDIYFQRDIQEGSLTEIEAQEIIDDFVIKLRLARQLRTPEYNELFAGDPMWITEVVGGVGEDGRPLVTKTSYRFLHTLYNLGPAPEPNITILWSQDLPENFKKYCSRVSIETDAIQYENDDLMRPTYGDDYGIACCVSAMRLGKEMQFFGARCNLPKVLLMALNGGKDEMTGEYIGPEQAPYQSEYLDYEEVIKKFNFYRDWLCKTYVNTMNIIHYMHDKYAYEKLQMALHDTEVHRFMAFGVAGLSVVADSLSAIKHAKVKTVRDENGLIVDFEIEGSYPQFGNDDDQVDDIAKALVEDFDSSLKKNKTYRNAEHTLSILTITSNVVYGKKTGSTPDGRKKGEAFAPGANPMHNRDKMGALASLNSVAKLPYKSCRDGISCTFSANPSTLGKTFSDQVDNLVTVLDGYFIQDAHHLNVNVINREKLIKAMEEPEKYPNLTIRVSGYAVNFHRLNKNQQLEVINRTFHKVM